MVLLTTDRIIKIARRFLQLFHALLIASISSKQQLNPEKAGSVASDTYPQQSSMATSECAL